MARWCSGTDPSVKLPLEPRVIVKIPCRLSMMRDAKTPASAAVKYRLVFNP